MVFENIIEKDSYFCGNIDWSLIITSMIGKVEFYLLIHSMGDFNKLCWKNYETYFSQIYLPLWAQDHNKTDGNFQSITLP